MNNVKRRGVKNNTNVQKLKDETLGTQKFKSLMKMLKSNGPNSLEERHISLFEVRAYAF